ncbi:MAG: PAS domain-containing protein [Proteobacteria bacterium]|nr:PAS domain-containing protein [Pseudomonadota bacterium]MBU1695629.1 PAS domain-containing protein [Pseudomonadota bacterium]
MGLPEKEIQTILSGIKDFVLIISPEKEIMETNAAFLKQLGCSREDVIGRKCFEVLKEDKRETSNCHNICPLEEAIKNKRHCQVELTRLDSTGKPRHTEVTVFPIWEKTGKIAKFIEISRDITQRKLDETVLIKKVEERTLQLKESHERLLHQDKMASLGKLSSSVVHEINNPVAGILNLVLLSKRILKEDVIDQKTIDLFLKYLELMETETRRISRIVSNLLVFARQSKIELVKFDLNDLIEQTLMLNANLLKLNNIHVLEELEYNLPLIKGSEDQLKQVLMNLISNAVESMATSGKKRLTIKTFSKKNQAAIGLKIKDTGSGIPKNIVSKIFEPFFTTKTKGKGVGLGLSVVYGIIQDHGAKIYVDSTPGKGTCFSITLYREMAPERTESSREG